MPRFISITGQLLYDQLVGDENLDHELCSLLVRCILQIDRNVLYIDVPIWRHFLEADFSTLVLSGEMPWDMKCIQDQFYGSAVPYNIANCRMFFLPACLQHGWCSYAWDMQRKVIHVFDPLASSSSHTNFKVMHEAVADKLHVALFTCLFKFFKNWHTDCLNWKKKY